MWDTTDDITATGDVKRIGGNVTDLWIELIWRCWRTIMLSSVPILKAFMPDPREPQGLRNFVNVVNGRVDDHEKRMRDYGI